MELAGQRTLDPGSHATLIFGGVSFGWGVNDNLQLDIGGTVGLNHQTPDGRLYAGMSHRI